MLEKHQRQKLRRLVQMAFDTVPYFRRLFRERGLTPDDVRGPTDLRKLPVLTKETLRQSPDLLTSSLFSHRKLKPNYSGGSTGVPVKFYQTADYRQWNQADHLKHFEMTGWTLGQKHAFVWGSERDDPRSSKFGRLSELAYRYRWFNSFRASEKSYRSFATSLVRWQPRLLVGYATAIAHFSSIAREEGLTIQAVQTSAELLTTPLRELISKNLAADVFDRYGAREVGDVAHECYAHDGLHISAALNYVEILKNGEPVSAGESGQVVVTNLINIGMPLIRYDLGDISKWMGPGCECKRVTPKMEPVLGRSSDLIRTPNGRIVHGEFFSHLFYQREGIAQFQVIQRRLNELEIFVAGTVRDEESLKKDLVREIAWIDPALVVTLRIVNEIPPSPSGKHRFTISEIS